jgi:signal transduction histidine kinase
MESPKFLQYQNWFIRAFLIALLSAVTCSCSFSPSDTGTAKNGVIDLRQWDLQQHPILKLRGEFDFWPMRFINPSEIDRFAPPKTAQVPGDWNSVLADRYLLDGRGYATYRVKIILPEKTAPLSMKLYDISTAYTLFINGQAVKTIGKPDTIPQRATPRYEPTIIDIPTHPPTLELVFHVANFSHRRGGIWENIFLGESETLKQINLRQHYLDFFLIGCILMMAFYHLGLYLLNRKNLAAFFFSLFCFDIVVRLLVTHEIHLFVLFSQIPWPDLLRMEYISLFLSVPLFARFLKALYPAEFDDRFLKYGEPFVLLCCLTALIFPPIIFTFTSPIFQLFLLSSLIYGGVILRKAIQNSRENASLMLVGFTILFGFALNDILNVNNILNNGEYIGVGLIIFTAIQAYILAYNHSRALLTIKKQSDALYRSNQRLTTELLEKKKLLDEKRNLQLKLTRAEKMEVLGVVAGTVAHDLNNILSALVLYPDVLKQRHQDDPQTLKAVSHLKDAGLRASRIVQDLMSLTRRHAVQLEPMNLNNVINGYLASPEHHQLKKEFPNIETDVSCEPDLPDIMGADYLLKKMLMNLIRNAAEAQPDGGQIHIRTKSTQIEAQTAKELGKSPGHFVVLEIQDTGDGIPEGDLPNIFEPFYSTKKLGKSGTGLGMTVVWGTVQDHKGVIKVDSVKGKGTTFTIYFPAVTSSVKTAKVKVDNPFDFYRGKGEKILVVDDQQDQLEIISEILTMLGYTPFIAQNSKEAIELVRTQNIELALVDLLLENEDGIEVINKLQLLRRDLKAVLLTGKSDLKLPRTKNIQHIVFKPFTVTDLAEKIQNVIGRTSIVYSEK